jgi:hypothetical protein
VVFEFDNKPKVSLIGTVLIDIGKQAEGIDDKSNIDPRHEHHNIYNGHVDIIDKFCFKKPSPKAREDITGIMYDQDSHSCSHLIGHH